MSTYIIDTETTGEEPVPEVIELAVGKAILVGESRLECEGIFLGRFKPQGRIKFSAMAVHNILPQELDGAPDSSLAKAYLPTDLDYMVGHNVDYDWTALGQPACKRICTLAIARRIWPGNDGHTLAAMSYQLATDLGVMREALKEAHGAGADVELCAGILQAMWETPMMKDIDSWEELWAFSEDARIPRIWRFGKHKGQDINSTDAGYKLWCVRQEDMDDYVKRACELSLKGRLLP